MKNHIFSVFLMLASAPLLTLAQCDAPSSKMLCYDYPGATEQNLNMEDIRTIAWYLRLYSHTADNPLFWTMYSDDNTHGNPPPPINSTSSIPLPVSPNATASINATIPQNTSVPHSVSGTGFTVRPTGTGIPVFNGTGPFSNGTAPAVGWNASNPFVFRNGSIPHPLGGTATVGSTYIGPTATVSAHEFRGANGNMASLNPQGVSASKDVTCMEWTVITRGTVMLLARLSSDQNASILYDDIAHSLDGITGSWGKWVPRVNDDPQPVLIDCNNAGGQLPAYVNTSNPAYYTDSFRERGYGTKGITLKLVHTPEGYNDNKRVSMGVHLGGI